MNKITHLTFLLFSLYSFAQTEENILIKLNGVYTNNVKCDEELHKGAKRFIKFYPNGILSTAAVVCTVTVDDTIDWWSDPEENEIGNYRINGKIITFFLDEGRELIGEINKNGIRILKVRYYTKDGHEPYQENDYLVDYAFKKLRGL